MKSLLSTFLALAAAVSALNAQVTAFTYQGRLAAGGSPASADYEMQFALFDAATNGIELASASAAPVPVSNGLFTVTLDFGSAPFNGAPRWLEISVNLYGSDMIPTILAPRQRIAAAPYSIFAAKAAALSSSSNLVLSIDGIPAFRIEPGAGDAPNIIGGYSANGAAPGVTGAFIGGGRSNRVAQVLGTIGGGAFNRSESYAGVIAGGIFNTNFGQAAVVGGGENNFAALGSVVSGGRGNVASGFYSLVGGGRDNVASNTVATVAGGLRSVAGGEFSFAAGTRAEAIHEGSFVWADTAGRYTFLTNLPFRSRWTNEFAVRASGGARFVTAIDAAGAPGAGVELMPGSGAWASLSDRNSKENISPVNSREILEKVAELPLATWNYKSQDASVRHIGPMAQDFHSAFRVGENERTITTVDADGVALAAVQGLNQKLEQKLKEKETVIRALEDRLARLEQLMAK